MPPHFLFVRSPQHLPRIAVSVTGWPKFGTSCILSDVGDYTRLVIAVCQTYGGKTWPDCTSVPGFSISCFDWLPTSLKYFTQSANILSVTQVDLSFQCRAAAGFFFRDSLHAHLGSLHLMEMVVGSHCMSCLVSLESALAGLVSTATALDGPTRCHGQSRPVLLRPVDGVIVSVAAVTCRCARRRCAIANNGLALTVARGLIESLHFFMRTFVRKYKSNDDGDNELHALHHDFDLAAKLS